MEPTPKPSIANIVFLVNLGCEVDLKSVANNAKEKRHGDIEYNPNVFPGIVFRSSAPKFTMSIFHSGKIICTGLKTEKTIDAAIDSLMDRFSKLGCFIDRKIITYSLKNIVASVQLPAKVNLDILAMECENTEYEPEQFPGLVLRLGDLNTVALIFHSGKMIITGAKTVDDVNESASSAEKIISEFDGFIN